MVCTSAVFRGRHCPPGPAGTHCTRPGPAGTHCTRYVTVGFGPRRTSFGLWTKADETNAPVHLAADPSSGRFARVTRRAMTAEAFGSEAEMLPRVLDIICRRFIDPAENWVIVTQHIVESRIPDVVIARVDASLLEKRLAQVGTRPLTETELRALDALPSNRALPLDRLVTCMRVAPERARRLLRALEHDGFVEATRGGAYRRLTAKTPFASWTISFETKREDWAEALLQARAHQSFADRAFVVFDAARLDQFRRGLVGFRDQGIGLIALAAQGGEGRCILASRRSPLRHPIAAALNSERILYRLLGGTIRQLPESRLPSASAATGHQEPPRLVGPDARRLKRLLAARAPSRRRSHQAR